MDDTVKADVKQNFIEDDVDQLCSEINEKLKLYALGDSASNVPFYVSLVLASKLVQCQIDSGASLLCISKKFYVENFKKYQLSIPDRSLHFYNGLKVKPIVLKNGSQPLVGRDFLNMYNIGFTNVKFLNSENRNVTDLVKEFKGVFSEGLGHFNKGISLEIVLSPMP
ncbi:hypothetical protein HHI36_008164 [Cryptolaemus montrouzieri]|uniref:Uncharacterized protein n=1 Tax=Cryptolaemus montrouzieri TaxID=559131 RepID=A0ABD2MSK2_9CUCU